MEQLIAIDHDHVDTLTLPMRDGALQKETKTTLMDLPVEILARICEILLSVREVNRGYIDRGTLHPHDYDRPEIFYDFHLAVLRVNKALYEIARRVFAGNHVIHVSSSDRVLFELMFGPGQVFQAPKLWTERIEEATDIRMDIYFDTPDFRQPRYRRGMPAGLIFLENLEDLVADMATHEILVQSRLGLSIHVKENLPDQMHPLKLQRALLDPLKALHVVGQTCTIGGAVEPSLARQIQHHLTAAIRWGRATRWMAYQFVAKQAKFGDEAYLKGQYTLAFSFYNAALEFSSEVEERSVEFNEDVDAQPPHNYRNLCETISLNAMASGLLAYETLDEATRGDFMTWLEDQSYRTGLGGYPRLYQAMACLGTEMVDYVMDPLRLAVQQQPELAKALQTLEPWGRSLFPIRVGTALTYLRKLVEFVPTVPATADLITVPLKSTSIDYERYILRTLGYQGDLYEDRIVQEEGHVFDHVQADRDVEWYRRKMAAQKAAGKVVEVWISPEIGKPGQGEH